MDTQMTTELEWTQAEKDRFLVIEQKQSEKRFQVAFCGHFSAGKSTILNEFIGSEVLPTSPIPTSANIISIQFGELAVLVKTRDGKQEKWEGHIPWEKVGEWGRDGAGIEQVIIYAPLPFLEGDAAVYDTPGVDSTDPTHQSITMEALYSMDLIVYVMDYNHVQSETNLYFLKQLSQEKKPLYIIINQVDKHDESELSFTDFDRSVTTVFDQWNIRSSKIFYTSMKQKEHQHNQFLIFEQELKAIMYQGRELADHSVTRLKQGFYLSQVSRLTEEKEAESEQIVEEMEAKGFHESQLIKQEELLQKREWLQQAKDHFIESFEKEWEALFKQVTLFPATTTDLTRDWLESIEPSFKMGLLFAKKKTEEERALRLQKLIQETQDKVNSQLVFHLQQSLEKVERHTLTNSEQVDQLLENVTFTVTPEFFTDHVKTGTKNREYVYTFTKERTASVVRALRERARDVVLLMTKGQEDHWQTQLKETNEQLLILQDVSFYASKLTEVNKRFEHLIQDCLTQSQQFEDAGVLEEKLAEAKQKTYPVNESVDVEWGATRVHEVESENIEDDVTDIHTANVYDSEWIKPFHDTLQSYKQTDALQIERTQLLSRINRVQNQTFVISLFGAFSAGKSSFANALLGAHVLPVSPHPTTATVSTVMKPDANHADGTATVQVKSRQELMDEIRMVASKLDEEVTLDTLSDWSLKHTDNIIGWQKTYAEYLLVLKGSLKQTTWQLGQAFEVSHTDLQALIADEQAACLLHSVTVYHDCELTRKGLILVDTPGVNSIHGRHTNVAFTQLRQSDAIFYVTYYNHAFSKTDQLFIEQMGKINESFQTDKLYFIVNASDLASSQRELQGVKEHVKDQLKTLGMKQPRLFAVSSKQGLKAKQINSSVENDFTLFEDYFYQQIVQELIALSYRLLEDEVRRYVNKCEESITYARSEKDEQVRTRNQLAEDIKRWSADIDHSSTKPIVSKLKQEAAQLFLFLRERIGYRLRDEFSEWINVATIRGKGRKEKRFVLEQAIAEWAQEGEYFLEQEGKATYIRLSEALSQACKQWMREWELRLQQHRPTFYVTSELEGIEMVPENTSYSLAIQPTSYSSLYTTDKAFFEGQQIRTLKEQLISDGTDSASVILLKDEEHAIYQVDARMNELENMVKQKLKQALERELQQLDALTHEKVIKELEAEYASLRNRQP
ncbi:dynamin family protein [Alkalicoccobacillus murimartini]|uniref:Small GTP-binding protein n=1 Tax=Alkalicoccobacillus murimartini TaxID=171685 RepID=A0ABT9YEB2_9BACI|nr:dynamin family protein [Alkalicoccobacillus murimartini]MDQ0205963.1 small GTP-binding protein [Alkalicoccobacillus murimartini]